MSVTFPEAVQLPPESADTKFVVYIVWDYTYSMSKIVGWPMGEVRAICTTKEEAERCKKMIENEFEWKEKTDHYANIEKTMTNHCYAAACMERLKDLNLDNRIKDRVDSLERVLNHKYSDWEMFKKWNKNYEKFLIWLEEHKDE